MKYLRGYAVRVLPLVFMFLCGYMLGSLKITDNAITSRYQPRKLSEIGEQMDIDLDSTDDHIVTWLPKMQQIEQNLYRCDDISQYYSNTSMPQLYKDELPRLQAVFDEIVEKVNYYEGHSLEFPAETLLFHILARQPFVKTICEIGFNAGHGTLVWLTSNPHLKVYSFDLGRHPYTRPTAEHLQKRFPDRLFLTFGDSTKTVPEFTSIIYDIVPEFQCDIILVDGGHTYEIAIADIENMAAMANKKNNILIFDDFPSTMFPFHDLGRAWNEALGRNLVKESFACTSANKVRGLTLARYV